ncbi:hypothetical protein [Cupriavidus malaysiensis]|uniref:Uncharacterized protein n=1 Tax=Cupriavidus malaysiensis TaxID=367825 RepID=A0A1D9IGH5_9BURK|nr:hypothetical protein [Cupriavidus malaysiensis]AOZ11212.1 hypothetical protein BKK80_35250 [Cupriavidus malaysiensis]
MQKMTLGDKVAFASEALLLLFKELSFGQCLVLQLIVSGVVWTAIQGGVMLAGALPSWALALGAAGFATMLFVTFRMGHARYGLIAVGMCVAMMLSAGSASVLVPDADTHALGRLPSLNDLVQMNAWLAAAGGFIGGIAATGAYVTWSRSRRALANHQKDDT